MSATMTSLGIDRMSVPDRLQLMHDIWDSVNDESQRSTLDDSKRQELRRRVEEYDANPDGGVPWEEVKAAALARIA